jgi:amphi-Trp domain-containing protein
MSRGEIEQKATLSRQELARWLAELARAIGEGGPVEVALAGPPVTLHLADELRCELEVEPRGDRVELEIELTWPVARPEPDRPYARTAPA